MTAQYGKCGDCPGEFLVKRDGTLRHHLGRDYESNGIFRKRCPGAGQEPMWRLPEGEVPR